MLKIISAFFRFVSIVIAVFFAILFVPAAVAAILLVNIDQTLLHSEVYKRALAENDIYRQMPALVAEQFSMMETFIADPCANNPLGCAIDGASPELQACLEAEIGAEAVREIGSFQRSATEEELQKTQHCLDQYGKEEPPPESAEGVEGGNPMSFMENLSSEDWQAILNLLFPPDEPQQMTEAALDSIFAFLNGEVDSASVPMKAFRERLAGPVGKNLVLIIIRAQPPCTEEQLAQINAGNKVEGTDEEERFVLCNATGEALDKLLADLLGQLDKALSTMPDEAVILEPSPPTDSPAETGPLGGEDPVSTFRRIRFVMRLSPVLPLILLSLVTLFGVRSLRGWLRWWGALILLSGLIALTIGLAALLLFNWAWETYAVAKLPVFFSSSGLIPITHDIVYSVARDFVKWIVIESVLLALLGLAAMLVKIGRAKPAPAAQPPVEPEPAPESADENPPV